MLRLLLFLPIILGCSKKSTAPGIVQPPPVIITPPPPPPANSNLNILYIGNSLTQVNDLPSMVTQISAWDSVNITYKDMSVGGYALEDHLNDGKIKTEIATGIYDYVVLQQGPSSLPASQANLLEYVGKIKTLCNATKSKVCVYMVWPEKVRISFLNDVIYSYTQAAAQTQSLLAPGGLAWKYAWTTDATLPLYGPDEFHPSVMGSFLAALAVYGAIRQKKDFSFLTHPNLPWKTAISEVQLTILKQAASKAL